MENETLNLPFYECIMLNISTDECEVIENKSLCFNPFECQFSLTRKEYHLRFVINSNIYYRNADALNKWYSYKSSGEYKVMLLEDCNEEDIKSICVQIIYQHIVRHSHYIYIKYGGKIDIFDFKRLSKCININPIKCYLDREKFHLPNSPFESEMFYV